MYTFLVIIFKIGTNSMNLTDRYIIEKFNARLSRSLSLTHRTCSVNVDCDSL